MKNYQCVLIDQQERKINGGTFNIEETIQDGEYEFKQIKRTKGVNKILPFKTSRITWHDDRSFEAKHNNRVYTFWEI